MTQEPWDDDRLAAAFVDRYDRSAPYELTVTTLERVRTGSRQSRWWPVLDRSALRRTAAAAAAVVAILAVVVMPRTEPGPAASPPAPSLPSPGLATPVTTTPAPSTSPAPAVDGFAEAVGGLPVRSVEQATLLFAEPGVGDTEVAVAGWFSSWYVARSCPFRRQPVSPIVASCPSLNAWLSSTDKPIINAFGRPILGEPSTIVLEARFVAPVEPPGEDPGNGGSRLSPVPRPLILIGHIHDDRAAGCSAEQVATCESAFVVDAVATPEGELPDPSVWTDRQHGPVRLSQPEATQIARDRIGSTGQVLAVGLAYGFAPAFEATECRCPATWFIRGYRTVPTDTTDPRVAGTPVAGWLAIDDATSAISGTLDEGLQRDRTSGEP